MSYTDTIGRFAELTATECTEILQLHEQGVLDRAQLVRLLVEALTIRADEAAKLADLALATQLSAIRNQVVTPVGATIDLDATARTAEQEVTAAIGTATAAVAIGVAARAIVLGTAQAVYQETMPAHGVTHWTRVLNTGACELCRDLDSGVMPIEAEPWFHKGCGCTTTPVEGDSE